MDTRKANIQINQAGGNASENAKNYRVSLPSVWMKQLGIDSESKEVVLQFDGESIIIRKKSSSDYEMFYQEALAKEHHIILLNYYNEDFLCTRICADYTVKLVAIENDTDDVLFRAFGVNENPSWKEYEEFLEERCLPRKRDGIRFYLEELGLDEYEPLEIIRKTRGRMAEDHFWLEIEER